MISTYLKREVPVIFLNHTKCFGWLGHVRRVDPGRIAKNLLYGALAEGDRWENLVT